LLYCAAKVLPKGTQIRAALGLPFTHHQGPKAHADLISIGNGPTEGETIWAQSNIKLAVLTADAYFFDIDGTLLVSRDLVHWNAMHRAMLDVYAIDANLDGIPYHGKTDVAILRMALTRRGIPEADFYKKLPDALALMRREVSANAGLLRPDVCPSIPKLLGEVRGLRKLLGVATGNLETVGWNKLSAAGIRDFFSCGSFGDNFELRTAIFDHAVSIAKQQLGASATVCFIGDTPDDIEAARNVDAQVVAVATGIFPVLDLARLQPDLCCRCCDEVLGLLQ
jgi:phosphoglycolate phosphatase